MNLLLFLRFGSVAYLGTRPSPIRKIYLGFSSGRSRSGWGLAVFLDCQPFSTLRFPCNEIYLGFSSGRLCFGRGVLFFFGGATTLLPVEFGLPRSAKPISDFPPADCASGGVSCFFWGATTLLPVEFGLPRSAKPISNFPPADGALGGDLMFFCGLLRAFDSLQCAFCSNLSGGWNPSAVAFLSFGSFLSFLLKGKKGTPPPLVTMFVFSHPSVL